MRINKLLSELGFGSRREVEQLVLDGEVSVNGVRVTSLSAQFDRDAKVVVRGQGRKRPKRELYIFHKPRSVITTLSDPQGRRSIADYISGLPNRVFPVGRLDFDVSGLLLLTNDGDFANELLHPSYEVEREYLARIEGGISQITLKKLATGFIFEGEHFKAKVAERVRSSARNTALIGELRKNESIVRVIVAEGSKHFVKRLLLGVGHPVVRLSRIRFGEFELGDLRPGEIVRVRDARFPTQQG